MNSVNLIGRITKDIELRRTDSGKTVTSLTIAVDGFKGEADFFDIICWDKKAEFVSNYFSKGVRIGVTGRLQTRSWKDKDGNNRKVVEVVASDIYFADGRKADTQTSSGYTSDPAIPAASINDFEPISLDEPLPF